MKIINTKYEMQHALDQLRQQGKIIGFVPTMGSLHEGHLSLVRAARERADTVVLSVYVNPTQFGSDEDLDKYPRDFKRDCQLADKEGVDYIFHPSNEEMYPEGYLTYVTVDGITDRLCGASRPDHFRGVTTICTKLFHIVKPHFAVFGRKDYQQSLVIKRMVHDLDMDLEILVVPIVREPDGLAMSSRNAYLIPEERQDALALHESLCLAEEMVQSGVRDANKIRQTIADLIGGKKHAKIDYIEIVHSETLESLDNIQDCAVIALAVFIGKTRLIDNVIASV